MFKVTGDKIKLIIWHQQIRASDIWRESQHEQLQYHLLDHHIKITVKETGGPLRPPLYIMFKGSTDDSQMQMRFHMNSEGKAE